MFIINPLTLMSDEDRFSRYNIITRLSTQVILVDPIHFFRTNLSFSELKQTVLGRITSEIIEVKGLKI